MIESLKNIRLLLLDVDGVLTDGKITIDNNGIESKSFNVRDGHGLKMIQRTEIKVGIITGRDSKVVEHRAKELGINILYQGVRNKLEPYEEIKKKLNLTDEQIAYVGDDIVDIPILNRVGFAATVDDASEDVKRLASYISRFGGGCGAVREICELILHAQGHWDDLTSRYFT